MHRRRASWNIPDLLAWIFTKNGSRSQWRRAGALGRWNTSARLPMNLARSASCATVLALTGTGIIRTVYDPACGTGGMLALTEEAMTALNPRIRVELFGQGLNGEDR